MNKKEVIEVGSRVITGTGTGKKGIVRFIGETEFATGEWIGIELIDSEGKNDGSVAGVRYFTCPDKRGLFVKRLQVKLDKDAIQPIQEKKNVSKLPSFEDKKISNDSVKNIPIQIPITESTPIISAVSAPIIQSQTTSTIVEVEQEKQEELLQQQQQQQQQQPVVEPIIESNITKEVKEPEETIQISEPEIKIKKEVETIIETKSEPINIQNQVQQNLKNEDKDEENEEREKEREKERERIRLREREFIEKQEYYEKIIKEKDEIISTLKFEEKNYQKQNSNLLSELTNLQSEHTSLLQSQSNQLSSNQQVSNNLKIEVEKYKEKLIVSENKIENLQKMIDNQNKEIENFQQEKINLQKQLKNIENECSKYRKAAQESNDNLKIQELEKQILELSENLEMVTLDSEQRLIDFETAEERIHELEAIIRAKEEVEKEREKEKESKEEKKKDESTSNLSDGTDLLEQNNRLKEALRRLQTLHITSEKSYQSTIEQNQIEIKLLKESNDSLESYREKYEELQIQFELQLEEMKDLAQQIDDTSGYADMIESLSTKNTELSTLVSKLQLTISDLEATQEIQEELDLSQRQEIESLRKSQDNLIVGMQTIETEKSELYRKVNEFKLKNERLNKIIEQLQEEIQNLKLQIEEEKNDMQLVSSRVLDERMLRRLLLEEKNHIQSLNISLSNAKRNQFIAEAQATRLQLILLPILQYISSTSSSFHSISFLPHDTTQDVLSHLLTLPSLRNNSSKLTSNLNYTNILNLIDTINDNDNNNNNNNSKTEETNVELFFYYAESLISSLLYNSTSIIQYSFTISQQYLEKQKESNDFDSILHNNSSIYTDYLSNLSQTIINLVPLCWHLLGILAYLPSYLTKDSMKLFYEKLDSNLWLFKDINSSLQTLSQTDIYLKESIEKRSTEENEKQFKDYNKQIQKIEELIYRQLPVDFNLHNNSNNNNHELWKNILLGNVDNNFDNNKIHSPFQWHFQINATSLLIKLLLFVNSFHLDFYKHSTDLSNEEKQNWLKSYDIITKQFNRVVHEPQNLSLTIEKYQQLNTIYETFLNHKNQFKYEMITLYDELILFLQNIFHQNQVNNNSILIIDEIYVSMIKPLSTSIVYSWLINGNLPGYQIESVNQNNEYCNWVSRVLKVGKNLLSIVEMENELNTLHKENSTLQMKQETLRIEKNALNTRLEETENMLKKYINDTVNAKNEQGKDSEEVIKLKKENKVLSEALEVMNIQLQELEEQLIHQKKGGSHKGSSDSKKKDETTHHDIGSKSQQNSDGHSKQNNKNVSSKETISNSSPTTISTLDSSFSSPSSPVSQLIISLQHEVKNWRLLTTFRLVQSFKLNPLPTKKLQKVTLIQEKQTHDIHEESKSNTHTPTITTTSTTTSPLSLLSSINNQKTIQEQNVKKFYRDIRLTRASFRVPEIQTSSKKSFTDQYTAVKCNEFKQLNNIRNTLYSFQAKNTLLITTK